MSCSNCHEDNYGVMIRADHLSQGQINGFPTYRLKNAKLNSSHGRFKGCMKNIRATPYAIAMGVAAGTFASYTPFMGFHFILLESSSHNKIMEETFAVPI